MHLFDQTHLLTLIFYLTAMRSTGTYPSMSVKELHDTSMTNDDRQVSAPAAPKTDQNTQAKETEIMESGYELIPDHAHREFDIGP